MPLHTAACTTLFGLGEGTRAPLRGVHVFLVVDDADSDARLSAALERADALVSVVGSIGAALTALEAMRPDVVLADVGDADELQAAFITRVRALPGCAEIPSMAVTADGGEDMRRRVLAPGYQEHVRRSVDASELCQLVASLAMHHG